MFLTRGLKDLIAKYKSTLPDKDFQSFNNHVQTLLNKYVDELSSYSDGVLRGRRAHQLIEHEIAKASHIKTSCHRGCGYCCHLEVEITKDDAAVLAFGLKKGTMIDFERLMKLAQRSPRDEEWKKGAVPTNKCVFLSDEGHCSVYNYRPLSCRKHAVTSDPIECSTPEGHPAVRTIPIVDIIISAAIAVNDSKHGALSKMLDKELNTLATIESSTDQEVTFQNSKVRFIDSENI